MSFCFISKLVNGSLVVLAFGVALQLGGCWRGNEPQVQKSGLSAKMLWEIEDPIAFTLDTENSTVRYRTSADKTLEIRGQVEPEVPLQLQLAGRPVDLQQYTGVAFEFKNSGTALLRIKMSLVGLPSEPQGRGYGTVAYAMPGEATSIVIPLSFADDNEAKDTRLAIPVTAFRTSRNRLVASEVFSVRLDVESADDSFQISNARLGGTFKRNAERLKELAQLPVVDAFGQRRTLSWEGKVGSQADLTQRAADVSKAKTPAKKASEQENPEADSDDRKTEGQSTFSGGTALSNRGCRESES